VSEGAHLREDEIIRLRNTFSTTSEQNL